MSDARVDRQVSASWFGKAPSWFWKALAARKSPGDMTEAELGRLIDRTRKNGSWDDADLLSDIYRERFST